MRGMTFMTGLRGVAAFFLCCTCLAYLTSRGCHAAEPVEIYSHEPANPMPRQIRFNLTIQNPTNKILFGQIVWFYAPARRTAVQQLQKLDVSIPYQLQEDALGNQIIRLEFDQIPPYGSRLVSIRADLLVSSIPAPSELKQADIFLGDEHFVETSDPVIAQIASLVKGDQPATTAANIYQWAKENIRYAGYLADDYGAKYAAVNKRGDCTEYAYLVTALARANGLPARTLGGYVVDRNSAPRPDEYHNWAEIFLDGAWRLVDAQKENFEANAERYITTRIISNRAGNALNSAHRYRVEGDIVVRVN
jgi:transglutaminase-like putative cysteine protease